MKIKHIAEITPYKMKTLNLGFLGISTMIMCLYIITNYLTNFWIKMIFTISCWLIAEWLIEKEVNNWLHKDAQLTYIFKNIGDIT